MISFVKTKFSKKPIQIELGNELKRFVKRTPTAYEVIKGKIIPPYEFDNKYESKEEQKENWKGDYERAYQAVDVLYNIKDFPNKKLYLFDSSGYDAVNKIWKNSFHIRVRGVGYYESGLDIPKAETADPAIYKSAGKRQLLRMIGCSKENDEDRILLRYENGRRYNVDEIHELGETLDDYVVQNISGEELQLNIFEKNFDNQNKKEFKKIDQMKNKNQIIAPHHLNSNTVIQMIDCLSADRADNQIEWLRVLRCLKNISKTYDIDLIDKAHEFSKLSNKYKKDEVNNFWNKNDTESFQNEKKLEYGSLCYWAKIDDKDKYFKILKQTRHDNQTNLKDILEQCAQTKREYQFSDFRKFLGKNFTKQDEYKIWKYLSDSIIRVVDGGNDKLFTVSVYPNGALKFNILNGIPFRSDIQDVEFTIDNIPTSMYKYFTEYYKNKSYSFLDFHPYLKDNPCDPDVFNLFQGFQYPYDDVMDTPLDMSKIQKILYHLEHIICDGDPAMFNYVRNWHSHLFQRPQEKIGVALLFYSNKHGAGKNKWCDFLMDLLGDDLWYKASRMEDLTSKFNYHLQSKLLVIGDEIANYAGYKAADQLKALITETNMAIEPKGKDPYCIKSSERYIFTTNSDVPLRIDSQDRRYITLSVSESKAGDTKYFSELSKEMDDPISRKTFLKYLITTDISQWNYRILQSNSYKQELISESIDNSYEFLAEWLMENPNDTTPLCNTMIEDYFEYCKRNNLRAGTNKKFGKMLKRIDIERSRTMIKGKRQYHYVIDKVAVGEQLLNLKVIDNEMLLEIKNNLNSLQNDDIYDSDDN